MTTINVLFHAPSITHRIWKIDFPWKCIPLYQLGINYFQVPFEIIYDGMMDALLDMLPESSGDLLIYRGWMLPEQNYSDRYEALSSLGYTLANDPLGDGGVTSIPWLMDTTGFYTRVMENA